MITGRPEVPYGFQITAIPDENHDYIQTSQGEDLLRYTFYLNPLKIRVVTFKGGGARGFAYQKFIQIIEENGTLQDVKEVGGSSAGAIAAVFTAMHFEPGQRATLLNQFDTANALDPMGNTLPWKIYRALIWPLYFVSKPISWLSRGINWIGNQFSKIPILGGLLSLPFKLTTAVLQLGTIVSPEGIAGLINLCSGGGFYKGDKLQKNIRQVIQKNTKNGIEAILGHIRKKEERERIIKHLISIGLLKKDNQGKIKLVLDITFNHFYHLSKLPGSQFKELYITGTAIKGGAAVIFNRTNFPDKPIHQAIRNSMSIPYIYQHDGQYMDGGCSDNYPIRHASKKRYDPFQEQFIDDRSARLGVRVDYHHELNHLWNKARTSWIAKKFKQVLGWLSKTFLGGLDTYAADDEVTKAMNEDYAQRTISLYDHGIGLTEFDLSREKREELNNDTEQKVNQYFRHHAEEKAVMETYIQPTEKPLWERFQRLNILKNSEIPATEIYSTLDIKQAEENRRLEIAELETLSKLALSKRHQDFVQQHSKPIADLKKQMKDHKAQIKELKKPPTSEENKMNPPILPVEIKLNSAQLSIESQLENAREKLAHLERQIKQTGAHIEALEIKLAAVTKEIQELTAQYETSQKKMHELASQAPSSSMPAWMQVRLLAHLKDKNIPTEEIFFIPGKSDQELEQLREKEIKRLEQSPTLFTWNRTQHLLKSNLSETKLNPLEHKRLSLQEIALAKFRGDPEQAARTQAAVVDVDNKIRDKFSKDSKFWKKQEELANQLDIKQPPPPAQPAKNARIQYQWHDRM